MEASHQLQRSLEFLKAWDEQDFFRNWAFREELSEQGCLMNLFTITALLGLCFQPTVNKLQSPST